MQSIHARLESAIQKEVSAKRAVTFTNLSSVRHTGSDRAGETNRREDGGSRKNSQQSRSTPIPPPAWRKIQGLVGDDHLAVVVSIDCNHAGIRCSPHFPRRKTRYRKYWCSGLRLGI